MKRSAIAPTSRQAGFSMIEVLVTLLILMLGLLGLAGLIRQSQVSEVESYQRVQALVLLRDMAGRINANKPDANSYVTGANSAGVAANDTNWCNGPTRAQADVCDWSKAIQGSAETSGGNAAGSMIGGVGCVSSVAPTPAAGASAAAAAYMVEVAWQGLSSTFAPATSTTCGSASISPAAARRVVSRVVEIGSVN